MPEQQALALNPPAAPPPAVPTARPRGSFVIPDEAFGSTPSAPETASTVTEPTALAASDTPAPTEEPAPPTAEAGDEAKEEQDTPEKAEKRTSRRFERRIDKLHKRAAEAQARAELLERQLNELKTPKAAPVQGEPTLEQFDFDPEKYASAKADFAAARKEQQLIEAQQAQYLEAEKKRIAQMWEDKIEAAEEKYADFNQVVAGNLEPGKHPVVDSIMEAENGPDIAYYLLKNPAEMQRINGLSIRSQVREIGRLEAKLLAEPVKPKTPSRAPAPITPLSGTAVVATDQPSENDDMKTWLAKRYKQLGRK